MLRISPWTVRAFIGSGKLTPVRIGTRVLLEEEELERFVATAKSIPSVSSVT
jgi:excisionase family DNA binding protein